MIGDTAEKKIVKLREVHLVLWHNSLHHDIQCGNYQQESFVGYEFAAHSHSQFIRNTSLVKALSCCIQTHTVVVMTLL